MALNTMEDTSSQKGLTLIELMVAMSLALGVAAIAFSAYLGFQRALVHRQEKIRMPFQAGLLSTVIKNQIINGRGIHQVSSEHLVLITQSGKRMNYSLKYRELLVNGKPAPVSADRFDVEVFGPQIYYPEDDLLDDRPPSVLHQLDTDMDGIIDFYELDTDGSGILEGKECTMIGLVIITVNYTDDSRSLTHVIQAHPRNRIVNAAF
jgi:prepilin-type N-terminal cleavage/methylation domain-containing protein